MSTKRIKIAVSKAGSLSLREAANAASSFQSYYQSRNLVSEPSVLYTRNLLELPQGVKSVAPQKEFIDELNWMPEVLNGYADAVTSGKPLHLGTFLGKDGQYRYIFQEVAAAPNETHYTYFHHLGVVNPGSIARAEIGLFKFATRPFSVTDGDPDQKYGIYQNRTLFLKDASTTLTWPTTVVKTGAVNALNAFVEISGRAPNVNYIEITGINLALPGTDGPVAGMCPYVNYVILWDNSRIYWNNPLSVGSYAPAQGLGGSTKISEAKGNIVSVVAAPNGIMIYCKGNIVYGQDTGDSSNPFKFSEVVGAGGLLTQGGNKLVSYDSDSGFHVALTTAGLQLISETSSKTFPDVISKVLTGSYVDTKSPNSAKVVKKDVGSAAGIQRSIVKGVYLSQKTVFIYAAAAIPLHDNIDNSRLFIYNIDTESVSIIEGDIPTITQRIDTSDVTTTATAQGSTKSGPLPNQFAFIRRIVEPVPGNMLQRQYSLGMRVLDFTNSNLPIVSQRAEDKKFNLLPSLALVGNISVSNDRLTAITSIKLIGDATRRDKEERASVRVYSPAEYGYEYITTFEYQEIDDTYYGYIEGSELQVEVEGPYLYLQYILIEIAQGGFR